MFNYVHSLNTLLLEPYLAYILFFLIGIILGLIGGGGSILGVPVLVYLLHYHVDVATGYSLFIVGITSLVGAFSFIKKGDISFESLVQFAIPSLITVFCVRKFLIPFLPDVFFTIGSFEATKQAVIMCVFSVLIFTSSYSMIKKKENSKINDIMWDEFSRSPIRLPFVIILGILVGFLSGFVGAGGGFIIVPVLLFFIRVPIKKAIGSSLCIIAINSLIGFTGTITHMIIDWRFLLSISSICIGGILIGNAISVKISSDKLKPAFGWFTLIVGIFVLVKELIVK
jgi:uncharacterized membrane protein YfcA